MTLLTNVPEISGPRTLLGHQPVEDCRKCEVHHREGGLRRDPTGCGASDPVFFASHILASLRQGPAWDRPGIGLSTTPPPIPADPKKEEGIGWHIWCGQRRIGRPLSSKSARDAGSDAPETGVSMSGVEVLKALRTGVATGCPGETRHALPTFPPAISMPGGDSRGVGTFVPLTRAHHVARFPNHNTPRRPESRISGLIIDDDAPSTHGECGA